MKPILGPDGKPLFARTRNIIGTEYPNAVARWSREHFAEATTEHAENGRHDAGFHCKGVIRVRLDPRYVGDPQRPALAKWSQYMGSRNITLDVLMEGSGEITTPEDLPSDPFIEVRPVPFGDSIFRMATVWAVVLGTRLIGLNASSPFGPFTFDVDILIYG